MKYNIGFDVKFNMGSNMTTDVTPDMITDVLSDNGINLPHYWDVQRVVDAICYMNSEEMYNYFSCANSSSFSRMMQPYFPNKPKGISYSKYLLEIINSSQPIAKPKIDMKTMLENMKARKAQEEFDRRQMEG